MSLLDSLFGIHEVLKDDANPLTAQKLNFTGDVTVAYDTATQSIDVAIGSGLYPEPVDPDDDLKMLYVEGGAGVIADGLKVVKDGSDEVGITSTVAGKALQIKAAGVGVEVYAAAVRRALFSPSAGLGLRIYSVGGASEYARLDHDRMWFYSDSPASIGYTGSSTVGIGKTLTVKGQAAKAASGMAGGRVEVRTGAGDGGGEPGPFVVLCHSTQIAYFGLAGSDRYVGLGASYAGTGDIRTGEDTAWYGQNTGPTNTHIAGIANDDVLLGDPTNATLTRVRALTGVVVQVGANEIARFNGSGLQFSNAIGETLITKAVHASGNADTLKIVGQTGKTGAYNGGDVVFQGGEDGGGGTDGKVYLKAADGTTRIEIDTGNGIGFFAKAPAGQQSLSATLSNSTGGSAGTVIGDASYGGAYGEIYASDNGTATVVSVQGTWYQVTIFDSNGASGGTTPDHTSDDITIATTGIYFVAASITFLPAAADTFEFQIEKNNGATGFANLQAECKAAINDVGSISISGFASLTAADTVELWLRNTTGTSNVTVKDVSLSLHRVGVGADATVINNNFTRTLTRINELMTGNNALGLFALP